MDLLSSGNLAAITKRSPQTVVRQLQAAGIMPELILNGIHYFSGDLAISTLTGEKSKHPKIEGRKHEPRRT